MSQAEAIAPVPGSLFRSEIFEQPAALERLLGANDEIARIAATAVARNVQLVRMVGHGSSDNAASYGVYAFGLLPRWTAVRDSITLTVHYDTPIDLSGSMVIGLSQSGQTPDVVEYLLRARKAGAFTVAITNDADSDLAAAAEATIALGAGPELAVAATKTYVNTLGALALLAGHIAGRGAEIEAGIRGAAADPVGLAARVRGGDALARPPVRLHRPHVRDRARHRVRDGAGDRAEAARDLPDRGRAADRDRPRARSGRRARSALPGLGDRLGRRDAGHGAGGGGADPRHGCDARRERNGRHGRDGQLVPATGSRRRSPPCSRRCSRSSPVSCSRSRSPAPAASTPTRRQGSTR